MNKAKTRERLTMGLTGALATGKLSRTLGDRKFASTLPAQEAVGEVSGRGHPHASAERPKDTAFLRYRPFTLSMSIVRP